MANVNCSITRREAETPETWHAVDDSMLSELKKDPVSEWGFGAGELLKSADKIVKVGPSINHIAEKLSTDTIGTVWFVRSTRAQNMV